MHSVRLHYDSPEDDPAPDLLEVGDLAVDKVLELLRRDVGEAGLLDHHGRDDLLDLGVGLAEDEALVHGLVALEDVLQLRRGDVVVAVPENSSSSLSPVFL